MFYDTQEQYIFVHDAVRELLLLGDTTIKAGKMRRVITQLSRIGDDRHCGYQQQFAVSGQIWQCAKCTCGKVNSAYKCMRTDLRHTER